MGVPSAPTPPAGSIGVGELRADAQTRTLWLGVPASIDPAQSLLVSDLVGLQEDMDDIAADAATYTDAGLATKSDVGHHHVIGDVDGLQTALDNAAALPTGCIVLWSGSVASIPGGWHLCDGTFGTPNLKDRFIVGAGGTISGGTPLQTGGAQTKNVTSNNGGEHTPTGSVGDTTLTIAQMPQHNHAVTNLGHTHDINDPGHTHVIDVRSAARMDSNSPAYVSTGGTSSSNTGVNNAFTGITLDQNTSAGISIQNRGDSGPHSHPLTLNLVPAHTHTIDINVLPPYMVLCYIMKV